MKKGLVFLFITGLLTGAFWLWSAESWRIGCLIAPFALVLCAVIACGIMEHNQN